MNNNNLLTYFETSLSVYETGYIPEEERLLEQLDKIWLDDLSPTEHEEANRLLREQYSHGVEPHEALSNIVNSLKENETMTSIFETKEEYLKLRQFWKDYHASGLHRKVELEGEAYSRATGEFHPFNYMESPLWSVHHLIYLAASGKSLDKAIGNRKKDTNNFLLYNFSFLRGRNSHFILFGDSIPEKYYTPICERIIEYLKEERS